MVNVNESSDESSNGRLSDEPSGKPSDESSDESMPPIDFRVDPQIVADLIRDEGEILHAYKDSRGYLTIGVGILIDRRVNGGITKEESRYLLVNRIKSKLTELDSSLPWWRDLSPARQRVILNMAFNLGVNKLLEFKSALTAMRNGDFPAASQAMLDSKWAVQVGERAKRLAYEMIAG